METAVIASYPDKNIQILFRSELQTGFLGIFDILITKQIR